MASTCPLCEHTGTVFYSDERHLFHQCAQCKGIFRDPNQFLEPVDEKERYLHHRYDPEDKGYFNFVSPIINEVKDHFTIKSIGLDYGCGHIPVLAGYLSSEKYLMDIYDPIFFDQKSVLDKQFDFIVCCEVMEHFYHPKKEFSMLNNLLTSQGKLICKTHFFDPSNDFSQWYYKNDPSHVFIYLEETVKWIKNFYHYKHVKIKDRLIIFSK